MSKTRAPKCPKCGDRAKVVDRRFNVKFACCGLWSWGAHPLVSADTHAARQAAHRAFDPLWKSRRLTRNRAYYLLSERLGISRADCHMKLMDRETAERVPDAVTQIWADLPVHEVV